MPNVDSDTHGVAHLIHGAMIGHKGVIIYFTKNITASSLMVSQR